MCVILSGRSLFAEGMAARLGKFLRPDELITVDARAPHALADVIATQPATVLLEAGDDTVNQLDPLAGLLAALPRLRIVQLDARGHEVQVITSARHTLAQAQDLVAILKANP
jgi:hypothetical protein